MMTDKPKWWLSWIVYALVGLLMMTATYVGSYLWLPETSNHSIFGKTRTIRYEPLRIAFAPAGWIEAKITGEMVSINGPEGGVIYFPDGNSVETIFGPPSLPLHIDP
jgi:hypothetical protein